MVAELESEENQNWELGQRINRVSEIDPCSLGFLKGVAIAGLAIYDCIIFPSIGVKSGRAERKEVRFL